MASKLFDQDDFQRQILTYIDTPLALIGPHVLYESRDNLCDLVSWLSGDSKKQSSTRPSEGLATSQLDVEPENTVPIPPPTTPEAQSPSGKLKLFGQENEIELLGLRHRRLTVAQYDVLVALCEAGKKGLSKDELPTKSHHTDAVNILKRLARRTDSHWKSVIQLAVFSGGRYRVL